MLNRRELVSGLAGLAVLGSRGWPAFAAPARRKRVSIEGRLSKAVFLALLGDTFTIRAGSDVLSMQLAQVDDGPASSVAEQFTLVFRGPTEPVLVDGSYAVSHPTAGNTVIFLQPSGQDARHIYYEAAFNLLL
jgi:uncharacterized protein DUF6916